MMMTNFQKVGRFRLQFGLPTREDAGLLPDADFLLRFDLMMEELHETLRAHRKDDVVQFADGLADLLYMVYGTAQEAGIPIDEVFEEVHRANMRKVRSSGSDDPRSPRGSGADIVKPAGWEPADVAGVLRRHGWRV